MLEIVPFTPERGKQFAALFPEGQLPPPTRTVIFVADSGVLVCGLCLYETSAALLYGTHLAIAPTVSEGVASQAVALAAQAMAVYCAIVGKVPVLSYPAVGDALESAGWRPWGPAYTTEPGWRPRPKPAEKTLAPEDFEAPKKKRVARRKKRDV